MNAKYQMCTRCVMDTTDPEIEFDAEGRCSHCTAALARMNRQLPSVAERDQALARMVERVRDSGKGKRYDCIIGVSGGIDSTTTAYMVKKLGLRPLAVHFDNGWNSELAVDNVKKTLDALGIPLYTYVVDWEEFRDLQLCFLKASVANCEAPTDHAIAATLFQAARRERLRYILSGSNLVTEAILPITWAYYNEDLRNLKALHRRFGTVPLRTMPTISVRQYFYYIFWKGIRQVPFLNFIDYDKQASKEMLMRELGWRDYGGKHYESVWTRFFQGYYLPTKFGYDKRKAHLSTLICSGQITRQQALAELEKPIYDPVLLRQDRDFVIKKFGLTEAEFEAILHAPPKLSTDYPSHYFLFHKMRRYKNMFRAIATKP
jgi:N-acetyl sugar amidotransferase